VSYDQNLFVPQPGEELQNSYEQQCCNPTSDPASILGKEGGYFAHDPQRDEFFDLRERTVLDKMLECNAHTMGIISDTFRSGKGSKPWWRFWQQCTVIYDRLSNEAERVVESLVRVNITWRT